MNNIIVSRGKEIIICLLIIIFILLFLLSKGNSLDSKPFDPRISNANLNSFVNLLFDPKENVHGVLLLAPDRHDKLVILNYKLEPTKPCFWDPKSKLTAEKTPVLLPDECVKNKDIEVDYDKQQILAITPATRFAETGYEATRLDKKGRQSIVFLADLDHRVVPVCGQGTSSC